LPARPPLTGPHLSQRVGLPPPGGPHPSNADASGDRADALAPAPRRPLAVSVDVKFGGGGGVKFAAGGDDDSQEGAGPAGSPGPAGRGGGRGGRGCGGGLLEAAVLKGPPSARHGAPSARVRGRPAGLGGEGGRVTWLGRGGSRG
jgi:hypothetical protein